MTDLFAFTETNRVNEPDLVNEAETIADDVIPLFDAFKEVYEQQELPVSVNES